MLNIAQVITDIDIGLVCGVNHHGRAPTHLFPGLQPPPILHEPVRRPPSLLHTHPLTPPRITAIIMSRFPLAVRRLALESQGSLPSYFSRSAVFDDGDESFADRGPGLSSMAFNSAVTQTAGSTSRAFTVSVRHPPSEPTESRAWSAVSGPERFDRWDPDEIVEMRRIHYTR